MVTIDDLCEHMVKSCNGNKELEDFTRMQNENMKKIVNCLHQQENDIMLPPFILLYLMTRHIIKNFPDQGIKSIEGLVETCDAALKAAGMTYEEVPADI